MSLEEKKIKHVTKDLKDNLLRSGAFSLAVLWQMLLPGYILTLDMVFTPQIRNWFSQGVFLNSLPYRYLLSFLNLFLTGWIIQKILLIALFFSLFYLALKFFPVPKRHYANYWAALFYSLNPFVYERFLAGHWPHLLAYAFLPVFFSYLLTFFREFSYKNLIRALFLVLLIGIFSLHFLVMAVLIMAAGFLFKLLVLGRAYLKTRDQAAGREWLRAVKYALVFGGLFIIFSSYWLVPYFINKNESPLNVFDTTNQLAFKTAGETGAETIGNVLTLYGFWEEKQPWANYFIWPKDNPVLWSVALGLLTVIILIGLCYALKNRRKQALCFLAVGTVAFILSCGLGQGPFKGFNAWLFDNIGFWRGFRDTQKFSGMIALVYAYFGGLGFWAIGERIYRKWPKFYQPAVWFMFIIPVLYTYTMIGGFSRQLQPVWYPQPWYEAKRILDQDNGDYKVLFLPWHQYLSLDFNRNIISANPAKNFFGPKIIQGDNMEVGGVFSQSQDLENKAIQDIILDEKLAPNEAVDKLKLKKVKYIMVMNKIIMADNLKYLILASNQLEIIFSDDALTLYQVKWYNYSQVDLRID